MLSLFMTKRSTPDEANFPSSLNTNAAEPVDHHQSLLSKRLTPPHQHELEAQHPTRPGTQTVTIDHQPTTTQEPTMELNNPFPTHRDHEEVVSRILKSEEPVSQFDWKLIKNYLKRHSVVTLGVVDDDPAGRRLILQLLGKNPPSGVVKQALLTFPDALVCNVSAFFVASQVENSQILCQLLRHVIERQTIGKDMGAVCPYPWIQMNRVSVKTARALLSYYPEGVRGALPNAALTLLDTMLFSSDKFNQFYPHSPPHPSWWAKLDLVVHVAEHGRLDDPSILHPIHTILSHVLSHPELLLNRRAACRVVWLLHELRLRDGRPFRLQNVNGDFPLHVALKHKRVSDIGSAKGLMSLLIDSHPDAAQVCSGDQRLPLHLALENGWPEHERLLAAAPQSLHTRDVKSGFYPFQIAAAVAGNQSTSGKHTISERRSLDTIYTLLREDPVQARGLLDPQLS